jgi:hypothetical protein
LAIVLSVILLLTIVLSVILLLTIMLSVILWFTNSDYPFGIFTPFRAHYHYSFRHTHWTSSILLLTGIHIFI